MQCLGTYLPSYCGHQSTVPASGAVLRRLGPWDGSKSPPGSGLLAWDGSFPLLCDGSAGRYVFYAGEAQQENPAGLRHACSSVTLKQWITRDLCLLPAGLVSRPLRCLRQSTQNLHGFPAGSWRTEAAGWFPACCTGRKGGICFPQAEKFDTSPASRDSALTVEKTRVSGNGGVMVVGSA